MIKSFNTKIVFSRSLSNQEQFAFWNKAIHSIKNTAVSGATQFQNKMEWSVDYSETNLNEFEAKKRFTKFLERQKDIIKDFSFYKPA